jgi:hypothetical protein
MISGAAGAGVTKEASSPLTLESSTRTAGNLPGSGAATGAPCGRSS